MKRESKLQRVIFAVAFVLAFLAWCLALAHASAANAQTTQPVTMAEPIGAWYQPVSSFTKWKARGINTLIGYESQGNTVTKAQYLAAVKAAGLNVWLQWSAATPDDLTNPIVTGIINTPDEPDGVGAKTPAQMQAQYVTIRAALVKANRNLPVWIDFDGNKIPYNPASTYTAYAQGYDVAGEDVYPFNYAVVGGISAITDRVHRLQQAGGKPVVAVLECSNQDINKQPWTAQNDSTGTPLGPKMRGLTAAEFTQEFNTAVAAGAVAIVYFPDQIGAGWEGYDGTPADVAAAMTTANATLAKKTVTFNLPALPAQPTATTTPSTQPTHNVVIDGVQYVPKP